MGVLSRKQFLERLHLEQRRADRSRAPLSLVVMNLASNESLDVDDLRDILSDLSLKNRDTDFVGYLGDGLVAFLLPYSGAKAAETFSKLIVDRIDLPAVTVDFATYTEAGFDDFVRDWLTGSETIPVFVDVAARKSRWALAIKRGMDIVGALSLIIACAPLMIGVAIAIKLSSPGPVIFRQTRIGRGGVPFDFYKFRSMRMGSDDRVHREYVTKLIAGRHHEINEGDPGKPVYKLQSDSRITPVGRFLRRTSIDELAQLFNVLRGEMSLVGPRPPITYETENYQSWHMRRLQEVRPGITGLWQVEGRSKTSFDDMVRLDLRYIRNWSLWLDVKILFKTIIVVVRCDGAD
jgi:exopolysaccharide biosynthesis polyprenyl glycosylphosphotransferase